MLINAVGAVFGLECLTSQSQLVLLKSFDSL